MVTPKAYPENRLDINPAVQLGPRTRHEITLRIHELERRLKPTIMDHAEMAKLRDLLKGTGGRQC